MLSITILTGSILLAGAMPDAISQSLSFPRYINLLDASGSTGGHDAYMQKMRNEMHEWEARVQNAAERTKLRGQQESTAAGNELHSAWVKTKTEAGKLRDASAAGWEEAKVSYENAAHELAGIWGRIRPEDK